MKKKSYEFRFVQVVENEYVTTVCLPWWDEEEDYMRFWFLYFDGSVCCSTNATKCQPNLTISTQQNVKQTRCFWSAGVLVGLRPKWRWRDGGPPLAGAAGPSRPCSRLSICPRSHFHSRPRPCTRLCDCPHSASYFFLLSLSVSLSHSMSSSSCVSSSSSIHRHWLKWALCRPANILQWLKVPPVAGDRCLIMDGHSIHHYLKSSS